MDHLGRGDASAPVDVGEAFPQLDAGGETDPSLRAPTVDEGGARTLPARELREALEAENRADLLVAASYAADADVATPPSTPSAGNGMAPGDVPSSEDTARRVLDALRRSAARARRVAAQTGTRLVVVRDGELVIEPVADAASAEAQCRRG